jgi:hypothetical protein
LRNPNREFVALGKFLDDRNKPRDETIMRLDRRPGAPGMIGHWGPQKIRPGASPLDPERKKKIQEIRK